MPISSKTASRLLPLLVCSVLLLLLLFRHSLSPSQVLFANDAPLGVLKAQEGRGLSNFTGFWDPLNWIGTTSPSAIPNVSSALFILTNPITFAKFYAPIGLLLLGLSVGFFFHRLGLRTVTCVLGGLAAILNTDPFSYACWGLASLPLALAAIFLGLSALVSMGQQKSWILLPLCGLSVGLSISEGFDVGAILSLYVAALVLFQAWWTTGTPGARILRGLAWVAVVAAFAAFMAAQALSTLIGTQIQGIVGTQQDVKTKEERWDEATMWSLPKVEALRIIVPGLFGYRLDTPQGGNYWGSVGQTPGAPKTRHSGSGVYAGVLVVLLAAWAVARSGQKNKIVYTDNERRFIWFWAGAAVISLLLAFGRHAPFYQFLYKLPYFSTIRNPIKFMHPFTIAVTILFAYGIEGLWRQYLEPNLVKSSWFGSQLRWWWARASAFERRWVLSTGALVLGSLLGWVLYASSRPELERYLQQAGFGGDLAPRMSDFSLSEVGWFILLLALSVGVVVIMMSGSLSGSRAKWGVLFLGLLLVGDLARADSPWIIYYNYKQKYATNPVIDVLSQRPYEHRVAARVTPLSANYLASTDARPAFAGFMDQWLQHQYQYYGVQALDIVQMPRMPELDAKYMAGILSPAFSTSAFLNLNEFIAKLTNHTDLLSLHLWQQFPLQTQAALLRSGSADTASLAQEAINRIIQGPSLFEFARISGVQLSTGTRSMMSQNPVRDTLRLNRLLLEDAYPTELARRSQFESFGRLWQLTNTRLIIGMKSYLDVLNKQRDPTNHSFRVSVSFDFGARPSAADSSGTRIEEITTVIREDGQFAIFEFGAALPRAKLFSQWRSITNDSATLQQLADPAFNPQKAVLVANPLPAPEPGPSIQNTGMVSIVQYEPKHITLQAEPTAAAVLLLNDKFDPSWRVRVDGKPKPLLRCNYIMRGVYLERGSHQVQFDFDPAHGMLYVTLAAVGVGIILCGMLAFGLRTPESAERAPAAPVTIDPSKKHSGNRRASIQRER